MLLPFLHQRGASGSRFRQLRQPLFYGAHTVSHSLHAMQRALKVFGGLCCFDKLRFVCAETLVDETQLRGEKKGKGGRADSAWASII
jgi:hypothetical protein